MAISLQLSRRTKGILSVTGCFLSNFTQAFYYLWASINIYVISYYKLISDPSLNNGFGVIYLPLSAWTCTIAALFSVPLAKKVGVKLSLLVNGVLIALCTFLASYQTNIWTFMVFFGILEGIFIGFICLLPVYVCFPYFLNNRGLIQGLLETAYGLGGMSYNTMALKIVNPENITPSIEFEGERYFGLEVADRVQGLFKALGGYQLAIFILVALLVFPPPEPEANENDLKNLPAELEITEAFLVHEEAEHERKISNEKKSERFIDEDSINFKYDTVGQALRSQSFILIFLMIFLSSGINYMISINFKTFGITKIPDDEFITWVGSIATLINGVTRPLWGFLFDKYGFKKIFGSMLAIEILISVTFCFLTQYKIIFLLSTVAIFTIFGMHFVIFTPFITHVFGLGHIGSTVLSFSFFAYSFSTVVQFLILNYLKDIIGLEAIMFLEFFFGLICAILLYKIKVPKRAL